MEQKKKEDIFLQERRKMSALLEAASSNATNPAFREQTEKTLKTTILHPEIVETYKRLIKKRLK